MFNVTIDQPLDPVLVIAGHHLPPTILELRMTGKCFALKAMLQLCEFFVKLCHYFPNFILLLTPQKF